MRTAAGGCASLRGPVLWQGEALAANLKAIIQKGKDAKLKGWTKNGFGFEAMFISLGPKAGTGHFGCLTMPSFAVAAIKSADLFIGKGRAEAGAAPA